jgi:hypothetical protein
LTIIPHIPPHPSRSSHFVGQAVPSHAASTSISSTELPPEDTASAPAHFTPPPRSILSQMAAHQPRQDASSSSLRRHPQPPTAQKKRQDLDDRHRALSKKALSENDAMVYLDGPQVYTCGNCRTHLTSHDDIISKSFHGRHGELLSPLENPNPLTPSQAGARRPRGSGMSPSSPAPRSLSLPSPPKVFSTDPHIRFFARTPPPPLPTPPQKNIRRTGVPLRPVRQHLHRPRRGPNPHHRPAHRLGHILQALSHPRRMDVREGLRE